MLLKSNKAQIHQSPVNIPGNMDVNNNSLLVTHNIPQNLELEVYVLVHVLKFTFASNFLLVDVES